MESFDHKRIEEKWQKRWGEDGLYETSDTKDSAENFYLLVEFPYPSGNLHLGHWYAFAVPDIFSRKKRMEGKNVLFPVGFDSFGLPAENAAIKRGIDPREWTNQNIEYMTGQLKRMGNSFDWSRMVTTSEPDYYRWTQWLFVKLFENGLAYRDTAEVNWCPSCKTVLANEQVKDNQCERCDTDVIQKELEQWFFKIKDYADRLLEGLEHLNWPEEIKQAQRNWIGKSEGAKLQFTVYGEQFTGTVDVFTTRPDTLYGATHLVLAPEHSTIKNLESGISNVDEVNSYIGKARQKDEKERVENKEKTGVKLEGVAAVNPATGEEIPVFVADYVLSSYGTGAIMAVPAHDERDGEFAEKYGIGKREVIKPDDEKTQNTKAETGVYEGGGYLINSGPFTGMESEEAKKKITDYVGGEWTATYRLRDWLISRQRYWGAPIPIVYDPDGNPHPVPEEHLPWILPNDVDFTPTGDAPLASSQELTERTERIFGEGWRPEVDTMDTFVDSSWYYLRYLDPKNEAVFSAEDKQKAWMPVDVYSGGAEHTTMHLLYSRFFYKALFDLGMVHTEAGDEPYTVRMNRGLVLGPDGNKMSKSKGNVVDPDEQVDRVGADTMKMYLAFIGPYNEAGSYPWDIGGVVGIRRFLDRVWRLGQATHNEQPTTNNELEILSHQTIKKVSEDIDAFKFNTAISALMTFVNKLEGQETLLITDYQLLITLLAPFAPHLAEELWEMQGGEGSVYQQSWPSYNPDKIVGDTVHIVVQIDGKTREAIDVPVDTDEEEVKRKAQEAVAARLADRSVKRVVYVPQKLINIVTE